MKPTIILVTSNCATHKNRAATLLVPEGIIPVPMLIVLSMVPM